MNNQIPTTSTPAREVDIELPALDLASCTCEQALKASACCSPAEQETCCEPQAKSSCCGTAEVAQTTRQEACGCR